MIRKCQIIYCANEHGTGDVTFPDVASMSAHGLHELFINGPKKPSALRADAKRAGWGRVNGDDYCPGCMEGM